MMSSDNEISSGAPAVTSLNVKEVAYFGVAASDTHGVKELQQKWCATFAALNQFTQQNLSAFKPVLTPASVITIFLVVGVAFIPTELITLRASQKVIEIVECYDADCVPPVYRNNKVAYIQDSSIPKNCSRTVKVEKHMKASIFIYYQLDNYYQNHRRWLMSCADRCVKSRSDKRLLLGLNYSKTSSCKPEQSSNGQPIVLCGLIAWSLFNDSYAFSRGMEELKFNRKDISWRCYREYKFGNEVYPFNFQNGRFIGSGAWIPIFH